MRRLLSAAAVVLAAGPALAADLPPAPAPAPRAPAAYVPTTAPLYNWGGVYFGVNGGYGFGTSKWTSPAGSTDSIRTSGGLVGATLGANFQSGAFVFGIEGDGDWAAMRGSTITNCPVVVGVGTITTCQTKNDWLATVRLRGGYAADRVLLYVTGGGAGGDVKATSSGGTVGLASLDKTEFGWTAGGGLEFALADHWTAKVEYLYVNLSNGSWTCTGAGCGTTANVSFNESVIRGGFNFIFGGF